MFVLAKRKGKTFLVRYLGDSPRDAVPVPGAMRLSTTFLDDEGRTNIMLASRQGMSRWIRPEGKAKRIQILDPVLPAGFAGGTDYMATHQGVPVVSGFRNLVYRFVEGAWQLVKHPQAGEDAAFNSGLVSDGDRLLLLGGRTVYSYAAGCWTSLHVARKRPSCLCVHQGSAFAASQKAGILRIDESGTATELDVDLAIGSTTYGSSKKPPPPKFSPWAAISFGDELAFSNGAAVYALRGTQLVDLEAPRTSKNQDWANHNQCLYTHNSTLYIARGDGVFRFRDSAWSKLEWPD